MKLKVFKGKSALEKSIYLKLQEDGNGGVVVRICDEKGCDVAWGNLLRITSLGLIERFSDIKCGLGFKLNSDGKLKIKGWME